jgi:hypothetical protein
MADETACHAIWSTESPTGMPLQFFRPGLQVRTEFMSPFGIRLLKKRTTICGDSFPLDTQSNGCYSGEEARS